jgi:hypothetical protein
MGDNATEAMTPPSRITAPPPRTNGEELFPKPRLTDEAVGVDLGDLLAQRPAARGIERWVPWELAGPFLRMPTQDSLAALVNDTKSASLHWRTSDMLMLARACGLRARSASVRSCSVTTTDVGCTASAT